MSLNSMGSPCIYENLPDKSCPKQFWSVEADLEKRFTCCARSWPVASGFCYRGRSNYLANYKVQLLQYLRSLAAAQLSIKNNSTTVQIASGVQRCGKRFLISPPRLSAGLHCGIRAKALPFYSSHLANGYLLMTEDELRIIITWNGELTWMPC